MRLIWRDRSGELSKSVVDINFENAILKNKRGRV